MALLPIILFVTTDIYEKVKIRRIKCTYSNDEKIDMILIYGECNKNASCCSFLQTIDIFSKTLCFLTTLFNHANDVYVKIYETAQVTVFYVFSINKQKSTLTLQMYCGLHFQIRWAHYHS
jgi:hypothetical protein